MTPEDKTTLYWTAGTVIGLVVLVAAVGMIFGWFDAGFTAKP